MRLVLLLMACLSVVLPAAAAETYDPFAAKVGRVVGGDTVELRVHLWPGLVKDIKLRLDGTVIVKSDNPAYEEQRFDAAGAEALRIVGRVIWMGKRV